MRNRSQRRKKAILPLKVTVCAGRKTHIAHTLDISASGARIVLAAQLAPGTPISVEFKLRRTTGKVVWCKILTDSKYDHESGVHLPNACASFWGIDLPMHELDSPEDIPAISFEEFMNSHSKHA